MKPLMLMRTRGLSGPRFANHAGSSLLSRSVGNAISNGISAISVPDVVGLSEVAAAALIVSAGLQSAKTGTSDPVVSQDPVAGTSVGIHSLVTFHLTV